jgi:hypothetical protein
MLFGLGFVFHYAITTPQYITEYIPVYETVYIDKPVEVVKEVFVEKEVIKEVPTIQEVEVIREVEKIIYRPLEDWQSVDELKAWLESDDAPLILRVDENGVINFNGQCEDVAFRARDRAYDIGKRLDTEILTRQECIKYKQYLPGDVYSLGANDGHYLNKAVIGNEVWFVQVDTDTIWLAYYLD